MSDSVAVPAGSLLVSRVSGLRPVLKLSGEYGKVNLSGQPVNHDSVVNVEIEDARTVGWDFGPDLEWHVQAMWPDGEQGGPAMLVIQPSADYDGAEPPAGGLSHTLLRDIDFAYGRALLRQRLEQSKDWQARRADSEQKVVDALKAHAEDQRVTDAYLALLSRVYVAMSNEGQQKPNDVLAEMVGKTPAAIRNHLWQATRKKFLERSAGRAGGRMMPQGAAEVGKALGHDAEQPPEG